MLNINQSYPCKKKLSNGKTVYGEKRSTGAIEFIVLHFTGNTKDTAKSNAKYFHSSITRQASAHYFVDENEIYQSVQDNYIAYSVGGGTQSGHHPYYKVATNGNTLNIEMCTSGNSEISEKTEANAIELVKYKMKQYNIDANHVIRHYDVNGKACPSASFRSGDRWAKFIAKLGGTVQSAQNVSTSTPKSYLSKGDKGSAVKTMQTMLIKCGYSCGKYGADGDFGSGTDTALRNFQKANGLTVDGKYGAKSKAKLEALYNAKTTPTPAKSSRNSLIATGQQHSINFTGAKIATDGIYGANTKKNGIRCVQHAINLDYKKSLSVDGLWGSKSESGLGSHYVKKGETQYLVTAVEILLMLRGYDPKGVECPGKFGSGLEACVKQFQRDNGLTPDGIAGAKTIKKLMGV